MIDPMDIGLHCDTCDPKDFEGLMCRCEDRNMMVAKVLRNAGYSKWAEFEKSTSEPINITHNQIVSRIQSFYLHLKKDYEALKVTREYPCDNKQQEKKIEEEYHKAADLLEAYAHMFEAIIYPWLD